MGEIFFEVIYLIRFFFLLSENTFEARLEKGSRGLGLSVTGGVDTAEQYPGLIRIKRIFPHQPAWECGILQLGDVILAANGVPLTGLTNYVSITERILLNRQNFNFFRLFEELESLTAVRVVPMPVILVFGSFGYGGSWSCSPGPTFSSVILKNGLRGSRGNRNPALERC